VIVDANVLLYAVDSTSAFHSPALHWLEDALNGSSRVGLPWASLVAFQRISTHPRVMAQPLEPSAAWGYIEDWLSAEQVWVPGPGSRHGDVLGRLLQEGDLRGNLVTDAHLASLAIEHGVPLVSFDSDFARFPTLRWVVPGRE